MATTMSVCLPIRNAERTLERFLASFRPFVDELCFLDTGSTDATLEILDSHQEHPGAPIIVDRARWNDDYAAARNAADSMATSDYVLWAEDDELLAAGDDLTSAANGSELRDLLTHRDAPQVVFARRIAVWSDTLASSTYMPRLYRRDLAGCWEGRVHERLALDERARLAAGVLAAGMLTVIHHPVASDFRHNHRPLVEREHADAPTRRTRFQMARHLFLDDHDLDGAEALLEAALGVPWAVDELDDVIGAAGLLFKVGVARGELDIAARARYLHGRAHAVAMRDPVWRHTDALNRADPIGPGHPIWAVVDRLESEARRSA